MKYYELTFQISPYSEAASDVLSALLAEVGFETFVPEEETLHAYVQQSMFNEEDVNNLIAFFPIEDVQLTYTLTEPEDRDWNEEWESQGFEDIIIGHQLLVCDARNSQPRPETYDYTIRIEPRQAFGTGTHQTTQMLLSQLLQLPLNGKRVIDAGCGTGILGFLCLMRGADHLLAYDIDEWSVRNTQHNASLNNLDINKMEVRLGDSSAIADESSYDLLIANINRNILLADMHRFSAALAPTNAHLLLSGFYASDVPYLLDAASQYGLTLQNRIENEEWTMLLLGR